jgi:hypothetical protein
MFTYHASTITGRSTHSYYIVTYFPPTASHGMNNLHYCNFFDPLGIEPGSRKNCKHKVYSPWTWRQYCGTRS